jgi:hypothetical protein
MGKTEVLGEKPVPVTLRPPQIPHALTTARNPGLCGGRPAANRLSHGTAPRIPYISRKLELIPLHCNPKLDRPARWEGEDS